MTKPYSPDIEGETATTPGAGKPPSRAPSNPEPPPEYHGTTIDEVLDRPSVEYKPRTFDLRVVFSMAVADRVDTPDETKLRYQEQIEGWIDLAERLFSREPGLKIEPIWDWDVPYVGELETNEVTFKNVKASRRWLDSEFDNIVAADKTVGAFQVLFVESVLIEKKGGDVDGVAFFPHSLDLCGRKHGILLECRRPPDLPDQPKPVTKTIRRVEPVTKTIRRVEPVTNTIRRAEPAGYTEPERTKFDGVLAHEIGHIFGLTHAWTHVGLGTKCNKDYGKQASTITDDLRVNVMDYWGTVDVTGYYLNHCQQERAAKQRDRYLTKDGEVNYRKLKGGR